ncbi:hypothetical protein [Delftia lacustris]|uniref:hypothetical protein n=1 Tax=Delftia lacustris TaxID=558537 RepID=UPI001428B690|nr:hypothetical protein [Delftia lacustris]
MNTSRPIHANSPAAPTPFHRSSHTVLRENINPETGRRMQVMTTSRLELAWASGELVITAGGGRVVVDAEAELRRAKRPPQARS